jgi:putative methyltransferase (TIGR04325 family)
MVSYDSQGAQSLESSSIQHQVWTGVFQTWEEAQTHLDSITQSKPLFGLPSWLKRQRDLLSATQTALNQLAYVEPNRPTLLPLLISGNSERTWHIVDFGGGSGWVLAACENTETMISQYVIIELPSVVSEFSKVIQAPHKYLDSQTFLETPSFSTDILYTNSCLQYQSDNSLFLTIIQHCRPAQILVDELLWSRTTDWFTIQINSDIELVSRFVSILELVNELRVVGYSLVWRQSSAGTEQYGFPSMSEFQQDRRIRSRLSLLFSRRSDH